MSCQTTQTITDIKAMLQSLQHQGSELSWRPLTFRPANDGDGTAFARLLRQAGSRITVFDTLDSQLRDLIRLRHPSRKLAEAELELLVKDKLGGTKPQEYGAWVYYPWSNRLVHLLDDAEFAEVRTNRNRYKITPAEQAVLATKKIGIVGLSVGQAVAAVLALERSFGELRLADFDAIDLSNLNRIRAGVHYLGIPKVCVTAREIAEIDPFLKLTVFPDGVTAENVHAFLTQGGKLDAVVEECDSIDIKILVRDRARFHGIPVVMDTSDRGMLDIERFDLEPDRPLFHGLAGDLQPGELANLTTEEKIPYVLRILGVRSLSPRARASMLEVGGTISTWPQLGSAVSSGGAAAADVVRRIVLGQTQKSGRFFLDPEDIARMDAAVLVEPPAAGVPASRPALVDEVWEELVSAAILAPSGGNQQPWAWAASPSGQLDLYFDTARSSGLIDFEHGGSFLALGCATENLVLAAHGAGAEVEMQPFPSAGNGCHVASFRLLPCSSKAGEPHWHDELFSQIPLRQTQRKLGTRESVAAVDLQLLSAAVESVPGAHVEWHAESAVLEDLARLVGAADRIRILNPVFHREMLNEIRWTTAEAEAHRDGIDIETLGLSPSDRAGFDLCRDWSSLELLSAIDGGRNLEKISATQIRDASAVGLVTMSQSAPIDYFRAGRAVQRMWLTATRLGIGIHPMTALAYFFARLVRGGGQGFNQRVITELQHLRLRFEELFQVSPAAAEVFLFRIGFGNSSAGRSLRRPVGEVFR